MPIAVANAGGLHIDPHFSRLWRLKIESFDDKGLLSAAKKSCLNPHRIEDTVAT